MGFLFCGNKVPMSCGECGKRYRTAARVTAGNVVEDIKLNVQEKNTCMVETETLKDGTR